MRRIADDVDLRRALVADRIAAGCAVERLPRDGAEVGIPGRARGARPEDDEGNQAEAGCTNTLRANR